ncbi:uncharacterized protein LOC113240032 isoform X3 [Hyposmocoma kahamanoa]|uniref:uncharacterized protein LOC113240032 isoform X3 n=1 Tax=Hyposmocoma kahamanoa TaxID=1477025 RepID=UPI000E6D8E69|nr:uncharacterized protein LOC113240032 isoform X3 [Hyposmocoma kahamanoa]
MMGVLWVVLLVALTGSHLGCGSPLRSTPQTYPHDPNIPTSIEGWESQSGWYAAVPATALVITAVGLLIGCTWCYRHKDCKLFTASATHLHDGRRSHPPDSGFSEPVNNNISEDNNNGPISLREMQNIANNNAAAYIVSENEERNRVSRESVVEFEPLPSGIRVADPLEHCADWFGSEDFPRNGLQYLREIGRGWFGRVVEGEIEDEGSTSTVAVKILNQNASLEDKARFLDEAKMYRDVTHENTLTFITKCLQEDPWILIFELCSMDLQQYLTVNRPKMAILNENGVPLQLMCDISSALTYLHSRGYLYGNLCSGNVLVRNAATAENARGVLGNYTIAESPEFAAPETRRHPPVYTSASEVWSLGTLIWEICAWGAPVPVHVPSPPDLPCVYRSHLYQVMQLCWNPDGEERPTAGQVLALINHLQSTHAGAHAATEAGPASSDFEERWQRLKPNSIPKLDEHVAIVHAPSTSMASHFTGSDQDLDPAVGTHDTLSVDMDTGVSRSSSIMSDKDPLSVQIKSESLTNLHGSLEDVRNIYLTHNETAVLECHQGNISYEDRDRDHDRSDSSVDPWLKDIIAGSQDDVSYYKDVSDVIKNLDNILNSEKTSSSESSHQASPSRDNLSLDCKKDYPIQSSMVKSPGISNFQHILGTGYDASTDTQLIDDDEVDRDTIGTLSHSFERHSDTTSQHTLENLTPNTPIKDMDTIHNFESQIEAERREKEGIDEVKEPLRENTELPKDKIEYSNSKLPNLKDLCVVSCSVSATNEQLNVRQDCEPSCDSKLEEIVRTEEVKTKSIDSTVPHTDKEPAILVSENNLTKEFTQELTPSNIENVNQNEHTANAMENVTLPINVEVNEIAKNLVENYVIQPAIVIVSKMIQERVHAEQNKMEDDMQNNSESANNASDDAILPPSDLINTVGKEVETHEHSAMFTNLPTEVKIDKINELVNDAEPFRMTQTETPELVQNLEESNLKNVTQDETKTFDFIATYKESSDPVLPSQIVQIAAENAKISVNELEEVKVNKINESFFRSDNVSEIPELPQENDSTVYMDLINDNNINANRSEMLLNSTLDNNVRDVIQSHLETANIENTGSVLDDSTVYLDLPSMVKETNEFLHAERVLSSKDEDCKDNICASTPKGSESSVENTLECPRKLDENLSDTKMPNDPSITVFKQEQKFVQDHTLSPFESPTKSHPTDTYDENSSVLLGPFENCSSEVLKGMEFHMKSDIDIPKEEILAFSSNFNEINLETPSPLRDGNFLNEVPDINPDDLAFEDVTISDEKVEKSEPKTDNTDETDQSLTTKHVSPSTPPNSPGVYLASTSQQKYLVDIDFDAHELPPMETDSGLSSLQKEIDLNQIELQITSKLAMAENENNMNIEYLGPLTIEGLVSGDDIILRDSEATPDIFLAGNGGSIEDLGNKFSLDEECVKALRNELELKLPLAQVASIEPAEDPEWSELPPPPELVVSYCGAPGALSPIAEETRHQLSAYENDAWNPSTRTDSSESYPEPCNNSTDEVTDLPTAPDGPDAPPSPTSRDHSTYTIYSKHNTYTIQKDIPSSKEFSMSADSLNGSPCKKPSSNEAQSPVNDKTYTKDDKESNLERISQVSPFLLSPTTDASAPGDSDNATRVSTLSRTTAPTDAKHSKPSDCLSKATSIDSWCSNDTLYNVEENFDDLALDPDIPLRYEDKEDHSDNTDTLTHHDNDRDASRCSTYIIHDSKSEPCETFTPDSITANDNYTYTKVKTEATGATSIGNTQTKDLAYGTLPSYSNCSTEYASGIPSADDPWKIAQPELIRRSFQDNEVSLTPPKHTEVKDKMEIITPQIASEPCFKKMDSVELSYLRDDLTSVQNKTDDSIEQGTLIDLDDIPRRNFRNDLFPSFTSTPLVEPNADDDNVEHVPIKLPDEEMHSSEFTTSNIPNSQVFLQSAEIRPQGVLSNCNGENVSITQDTGLLLEADSKILNSNYDGPNVIERTPLYTDFETLAAARSQEVNSKSSQSLESGMSSGDFGQFESSVRARAQDLSSVIDASSLLLNSERQSYDIRSDPVESSTTRVPENVITQPSDSISDVSNFDPTAAETTPSHSDLESSTVSKLLGTHLKSILSDDSVPSSGDFRLFENSVKGCPQDLSSPADSKLFTDNKVNETVSSNGEYSRPIINETVTFAPNITNVNESQIVQNTPLGTFLTSLDVDDENEQPHSFIITEVHRESPKETPIKPYEITTLSNALIGLRNDLSENKNLKTTCNFHEEHPISSFGSDICSPEVLTTDRDRKLNGIEGPNDYVKEEEPVSTKNQGIENLDASQTQNTHEEINGSIEHKVTECNGSEKFATVNFITEPFEELLESNVDGGSKEKDTNASQDKTQNESREDKTLNSFEQEQNAVQLKHLENHEVNGVEEEKVTSVTENFLQNEKKFCQMDNYLPLLHDIRFTGPGSEIMSTSFTQDSPTDPNSPECEQDSKPDTAADIAKEWDSDSDSQTSNSSSGEFIWKDGEGHETAVVPTTHFDHHGVMQRGGGGAQTRGTREGDASPGASDASGSGDSGSGSEGDEVEFVPSSWDCLAAPSKSSLRSLEQAPPDSKKRVVFKRQKYHCVYEYPREVADIDTHSPAYLPDLSTYCDWDPTSAEEAELGYGQLFGGPSPLDLYPLRAGIAFGADYDEDFFISSSARPFESLGIMSTTSQFFPGKHIKPSLLEGDIDTEEHFPPPPSPLATPSVPSLTQTRTPSLDFTTPDSGVEDITPGSTTTEEDFKTKKLPESETQCWRGVDSGSSSESVSPSSPGGEALGGLRHTRDKLKLDLPPSPHIPSPRHARVFNFVLDKPRRRHPDIPLAPPPTTPTPLVMTDETPVTNNLPLQKEADDIPVPEPTFSTFGKSILRNSDQEQKMILDEVQEGTETKEEVKAVETVKGEGTVLDSGDEDSGIESSSKATLERKTPNVS